MTKNRKAKKNAQQHRELRVQAWATKVAAMRDGRIERADVYGRSRAVQNKAACRGKVQW